MSEVEERIRAALELRDLMIAMRREALKRAFPSESEAEIEERLTRWVLMPKPPVKARRGEARYAEGKVTCADPEGRRARGESREAICDSACSRNVKPDQRGALP